MGSGNTGMGLALAAVVKGYKCIFTTTDKTKQGEDGYPESRDGAEVIVCPTNVEPEDPRSYYSVARRLAKEIPNSFSLQSIRQQLTGWRITKPPARKYGIKRMVRSPTWFGTPARVVLLPVQRSTWRKKIRNIQIWAIDVYGSCSPSSSAPVIDMNQVHPCISEGFGEDFVPENYECDRLLWAGDTKTAPWWPKLAKKKGSSADTVPAAVSRVYCELKDKLKKDDPRCLHIPRSWQPLCEVRSTTTSGWLKRGFLM